MTGSRNRTAGHGWERALAKALSLLTGMDIVTTRSLTHGSQGGADLSTVLKRDEFDYPIETINEVLGWSVEAKNEKGYRIPAWSKQAEDQAKPGTPWVLMVKRKGVSDPLKGFAILPIGPFWKLVMEVVRLRALVEELRENADAT